MKDLMKQSLSEHFYVSTYNFFSEKEILLIFDDFDLCLENPHFFIEFEQIFHALRDHKIPLFIVTESKIENNKNSN